MHVFIHGIHIPCMCIHAHMHAIYKCHGWMHVCVHAMYESMNAYYTCHLWKMFLHTLERPSRKHGLTHHVVKSVYICKADASIDAVSDCMSRTTATCVFRRLLVVSIILLALTDSPALVLDYIWSCLWLYLWFACLSLMCSLPIICIWGYRTYFQLWFAPRLEPFSLCFDSGFRYFAPTWAPRVCVLTGCHSVPMRTHKHTHSYN